ncbi:MAG TPA: helix-turn-helix transcriptional regulator [Amycolatopsis sp.]|nr:helix-turn-helix transcriptional regulator [Amycolatopsis sp.]
MSEHRDALDTRLRELATRVRRARRERDLSQEELADRAGVSRSVVAELERSRLDQPERKQDPRMRPPRNITLDSLFRMADALEMHPADLLEDRDPPPERRTLAAPAITPAGPAAGTAAPPVPRS